FDRIIELHVAGSMILDRDGIAIYEDLHGASPIPQVVLDMLASVLPRCPNLRAVTIEVEDASADTALEQAAQVKKIVDRARGGTMNRAPAGENRRSGARMGGSR